MHEIIHNPRSGCALHGAVQTIGAIKGAVPIVHSNPGCAVSNYLANKASGAGNGYVSGYSIPGTGSLERHIIFGGASRLREQIKNTIKVVCGDLYIVLNSCEAAMVGDDLDAMTREAQEQGEAVIDSLLAGFHGDSYCGYENVVADIIQKLPIVRSIGKNTQQNLVNVLGIIPNKDVFFRGKLEETARILKGIGLESNTFFGYKNGVEEFANAQNASLTIVFSKWGLKAAEKLKELYGIPVLTVPSVPVGPDAVADFIHAVAEQIPAAKEKAEAFLKEEQQYFQYYFQALAEDIYEEHAGKNIAVVGEADIISSIAGFLSDYLGANVETAIITDLGNAGTDAENETEQWKKLAKNVYFSNDGKEIQSLLQSSNVDFILGSSLEDGIAIQKNIQNLPISYPVYHQVIANKSYAGIRGALSLTEDFLTGIKADDRKKKETLIAEKLYWGNGRAKR